MSYGCTPSWMACGIEPNSWRRRCELFLRRHPHRRREKKGRHCSGSSPTVSNRHTLWNLGVGMELAGDT
jgi:hypothetical protein